MKSRQRQRGNAVFFLRSWWVGCVRDDWRGRMHKCERCVPYFLHIKFHFTLCYISAFVHMHGRRSPTRIRQMVKSLFTVNVPTTRITLG